MADPDDKTEDPPRRPKQKAPSTAAASAALRPAAMPRWSLGLLDVLHAAVFGAAAVLMPWKTFTVFGLLAGAVALMHAIRAALVLSAHPLGRVLFRYGSMLALLLLAYLTWGIGSSAVYVARLYGTLGQGIAAAAGAVWAVGVLLTLPLACWGIAITGGLPRPGRAGLPALSGLVVVAGAGLVFRDRQAALDRAPIPEPAAVEDAVRSALGSWRPLPARKRASLYVASPFECDGDVRDGGRLFLTWASDKGVAAKSCAKITSAPEIRAAVERVIADGAVGPIKIDLVDGYQDLPALGPLLGMVALRPGIDGVCAGARCLMPWQLVALDQFSQMGEVSSIQLRFGVTPTALWTALGQPAGEGQATFEGLTRISTQSLLVDGAGALRSLVRLRDGSPELSAEAVRTAVEDARRFILEVQEKDGRFGYIVDPFKGTVSYENFSVPRQAGTTLALCEMEAGAEEPVKVAAVRSLKMLATLEQRSGDLGAIVYPKGSHKPARLGDTALPLLAFLGCRHRVGKEHDELIHRLASTMLAMQREDGSFHPNFDVKNGAPMPGADPLYAEGQVVMALVLWEAAADLAVAPPPELGAAIDRAMDHFAGPYWDHMIGDFFYLEENWHCLAARAALRHHRHDAYERFCIDYVTMKARLTFDEDSDVAAELVGAYGFGNVLPPHNTATAGFGEALAAKMALLKARGQGTGEEEVQMTRTLQFLLAQQWQAYSCFACTTRRNIVGGFSESVGSPQIRIDYVQHALAAMGHGGNMMGYFREPEG